MKKTLLCFLAICSILSITIIANSVNAIDFSKNEEKYIKLCSSSSLTNANKETCEQFNAYLSKKNKELKNEISETQKELTQTKSNINEVTNKINSLDSDIASKEAEINYLLSSITKIEKNIKKKEELMRERLYVMQTTYNSNWIIDVLFGAEDFSTFFSRLNSINDITAYEKDLIKDLTKQKASLDSQKATLENAKATLQQQKKSQLALQDQLIDLKIAQQNTIAENQEESKKITAEQKKIDAALESLISRAPSGGGGSYVPGSSKVGNAIAQKALTKLGSRYWWGAPGGGYGDPCGLRSPSANYFDCSGLVAWAHIQCGVEVGRKTAAGYSASGKAVSRSELQAGDVITFNYGSGVQHIGIYIGGGNFVHAAGYGSSTRGQYPNQCVKTASLAGYWEKYVYNYRRLY